MNRREFLKKSLEGIIVGIPLISGCGKNPLNSGIKELDIVDFIMLHNQIYHLLTSENNIYYMSSSDEVTLISKNGRKKFYKFKLKELFTDNIDINRYDKICRDDSFCYGIILAGWSSRFVKIEPVTGEEKFLRYMQGEPAGLLISEEKLWYISNRSKLTSLLHSYDKHSGGDIDFFHTPLNNVVGLSINDEGNFITYEQTTNSFVTFKIENNEFKLLGND